jgi:hypothetical protein
MGARGAMLRQRDVYALLVEAAYLLGRCPLLGRPMLSCRYTGLATPSSTLLIGEKPLDCQYSFGAASA